jgi:SCF-associated factor 1
MRGGHLGIPSMDRYQEAMAELDKDESTKAIVPDGGTVIPCHTWEMNMDPVKLPILPDLPDLPATGLPEEERRKETKLIKIAAFDNSLVGLTNKGHVLKMDGLIHRGLHPVWNYVSESAQMIWHPF